MEELKIIRQNLILSHIVTINDIVEKSHLFEMDIDDINIDINIENKNLKQNENILVFQMYINNEWEKYCYLKINTSIGLDNNTKCVCINQIIVDENVIDNRLFCKIIHILLQQINNEFNNRIIVGNKNICFKNNVLKYANEIGKYIYDLFYDFTNQYCPEYTLQTQHVIM